MNEIEKRALAVQAAMNHKVGGTTPAKYLQLNEAQWEEVVDAIIAALSAAPQGLPASLEQAARDALPFVAYAYSKGVAGAEEAGRAIETALGDMPEQQSEGAYHQALQQIGYALGLPAGSDLTTQCIPAIEAMRRDVERLDSRSFILTHRPDEWGNTRTHHNGVDMRSAIDEAMEYAAKLGPCAGSDQVWVLNSRLGKTLDDAVQRYDQMPEWMKNIVAKPESQA
ncbi:hypothetical protein ABFO19_09290 [Xanthomonas citri pv. glycines]|uniref:Phage protein n=1 Tax=Xanthomonas campestris pv. glycines TaxID=473421 RepID=A0AAX0I4U9_XANCG|nr:MULTISPECIES: hypothetical protein [Xanthomonas]AOY63404.1 hypothetical protein BHE84_15405 [Xanthomonas citri pv. glycines str. 8ra]EWC53113.1 hypothetical protein XAR_0553 [Xanthomonas citri pv. glycines str. 8ra]OEY98646.1 hypothetical protein BIY41_09780 [Xanthomonas citri pv. glycines]OOW99974.1 hypothetical protein Xgly_03070 [Xanthomonas citri pv. glycines]QDR44947.1 hypothetical protein FPK90_09740 [Xanthomonas citri pv. glycines]